MNILCKLLTLVSAGALFVSINANAVQFSVYNNSDKPIWVAVANVVKYPFVHGGQNEVEDGNVSPNKAEKIAPHSGYQGSRRDAAGGKLVAVYLNDPQKVSINSKNTSDAGYFSPTPYSVNIWENTPKLLLVWENMELMPERGLIPMISTKGRYSGIELQGNATGTSLLCGPTTTNCK